MPIRLAPPVTLLLQRRTRGGRPPPGRLLQAILRISYRWNRSPPLPLAIDDGIDPVLLLVASSFQIYDLGAIVLAFINFWPNRGLSRMLKAARLVGLMFGRSIFEFGRLVVPGLTTAEETAVSPS